MESLKNNEILKLYQEKGNSITEAANILLEKSKTVKNSPQKFNTYYQRVKRIIETLKKIKKGKSRVEG